MQYVEQHDSLDFQANRRCAELYKLVVYQVQYTTSMLSRILSPQFKVFVYWYTYDFSTYFLQYSSPHYFDNNYLNNIILKKVSQKIIGVFF